MVNQNSSGDGTTAPEAAVPKTIRQDLTAQAQDRPRSGQLSTYSCAECGGTLWQVEENKVLYFQCHVGHTYAPEVLLQQKSEFLEGLLWSAVRTLVEKRTLISQLLNRLPGGADPQQRARIEEMARLDSQEEQVLRQMLEAYPNPTAEGHIVIEALEKARERTLS